MLATGLGRMESDFHFGTLLVALAVIVCQCSPTETMDTHFELVDHEKLMEIGFSVGDDSLDIDLLINEVYRNEIFIDDRISHSGEAFFVWTSGSESTFPFQGDTIDEGVFNWAYKGDYYIGYNVGNEVWAASSSNIPTALELVSIANTILNR